MVPSVEQEIRDLHELFGSSRDPEGRAFVPLADAYRRAGDPGRALQLLDEGLHRHPRLAAARLVEALTRVDLFDTEGAEAAFRLVLEADPDNARALVGLGHLLTGEGHDDGEGEALVRRGLALDPDLEGEAAPPRTAGVDEAASEAPSVAEVASLLEWDLSGAVHDGPGPVDAPDAPLPPPDAATPPEAAAVRHDDDDILDPADLAPTPALAVDELDIEWEAEGFYGAVDAADSGDVGAEEGGDAPEPGDFVGIGDLAALQDDVVEIGDLAALQDDVVEIGDLAALQDDVVDEAPSPWSDASNELGAEAASGAQASNGTEASSGADAGADELPPAAPVEEWAAASEAAVIDETDPAGLVLDAASLAPDDWGAGPAAGPGALPTGDVDVDDLLMDLADLAPDIEPGSRPEDDDPADEVLPTRTLGELYARQGLIDQAVKVFEELARHAPSDSGLQARLAELRAGAAPVADALESEADEPSITDFLDQLLAWESTSREDGADSG